MGPFLITGTTILAQGFERDRAAFIFRLSSLFFPDSCAESLRMRFLLINLLPLRPAEMAVCGLLLQECTSERPRDALDTWHVVWFTQAQLRTNRLAR